MVGIAGNQTIRAGRFIRELNLPFDIIATSDDWGVSRPAEEFFHKLVEVSGHLPREILYVGDRLDNDISPAMEAGLATVWLRRGPWRFILGESFVTPNKGLVLNVDLQIPSMKELLLAFPKRG